MTEQSNHRDGEHEHVFHIFVNGRKKTVSNESLTFEELVGIRFDGSPPQGENWYFTVTYRNGPKENREGTLTAEQSVKLKDGMKFDVTATDRS